MSSPDPWEWYHLLRGPDSLPIEAAIEMARHLDIGAIATGPARAPFPAQRLARERSREEPPFARWAAFYGAGHDHHLCLDSVLAKLWEHPGMTPDIHLAGLRSPVLDNRIHALESLLRWPDGSLPESLHRAVEELMDDPDPWVRWLVEGRLFRRPLVRWERELVELALSSLPTGEWHGYATWLDAETLEPIPRGEPRDPSPYLAQLDDLRVVSWKQYEGPPPSYAVDFQHLRWGGHSTLCADCPPREGWMMHLCEDRTHQLLTDLDLFGVQGEPFLEAEELPPHPEQ